ncbi:MAG: single-stranded-DNA-specific exonuclease RecJ [Bacteroidota bacterium]
MTYRWTLRPVERPEAVDQLRHALNDLPAALARALVLRGIHTLDEARLFFRGTRADLHDPFLMQDMDVAAKRVAHAVTQGQRVFVYGDYDTDGTTSTALMTSFLERLGAEVTYYIPDRIEEGYGLGRPGLDAAHAWGADLVIALDCGITAHDEATYARSLGLDLIICDHHTALETVPDALAVLDPKRPDCPYPFDELCGCGVGYKLACATLQALGRDLAEADPLLDLVAMATAGDIVPLRGENRILLRAGLDRIRTAPRMGLRRLAEQARVDLGRLTTSRIVFGLSPRINAAGRMGDAKRAVALLLADDPTQAQHLATTLETANQERRSVNTQIRREALREAERYLSTGRLSVVLHNPAWHPGIVGIVASRVVETFYRPTILLCTVNGVVKGSARSVHGLNVYDALTDCADLIDEFGGHDYAAGLSLQEDRLPEFKRQFDEAVRRRFTADLFHPTLDIDAELDLREVDGPRGRFWAILRQFEPTGPENPAPLFQASDLMVMAPPRLLKDEHLKFSVRPRLGDTPFDVIAFGLGDKLPIVQQSHRTGLPLELAFHVDENTYRGVTSLQLQAKDIRLQPTGDGAA